MKNCILICLVIISISCGNQVVEGLRIALMSPLNSKSHDAMSDRLARALAARGHQIEAYTHYPPKKPIANYRHHSLEGSMQAFTNNLSFSEAVQFRAHNPRMMFELISKPLCELLRAPVFDSLLNRPSNDPPYDLVIIQVFVTDCYLAWARHLNVPLIAVTSLTSLVWYDEFLGIPSNTAVNPAFGVDFEPPMNFWQRLYNTVWSSFVTYKFLSILDQQNQFVESTFGADYPGIKDLRRDLDLLIVNSHHSLEGIKAYPPAVVPAAGLHIPDEDNSTKLSAEVQKWLDESRHGCVYFTLGSMVRFETFPKYAIDAFYESFKRIAPVRVLMKVAKPEDLPPGLPSNVLTQTWFPQVQVFKHKNVKAFITHGGLMSSIEAISARIPMIGVPIFGDQYQNVKVNVNRGIATSVQIESLTADELTQAIKDVLDNPSYQENMDILSAKFLDRPIKPLDTAIYWVEYVARHGKKCLRSPLVDMPWWQANLLDVYGFLLSILFVVYYILKFSIKKIWSTCCARKHQISSKKLQSKKKQ